MTQFEANTPPPDGMPIPDRVIRQPDNPPSQPLPELNRGAIVVTPPQDARPRGRMVWGCQDAGIIEIAGAPDSVGPAAEALESLGMVAGSENAERIDPDPPPPTISSEGDHTIPEEHTVARVQPVRTDPQLQRRSVIAAASGQPDREEVTARIPEPGENTDGTAIEQTDASTLAPQEDSTRETITEEQPEVRRAQIAAFAAQLRDPRDRKYVFNNLEELAQGGVGDVVRITGSVEYAKDENGDVVGFLPAGTEVTVATAEDFAAFVQEHGNDTTIHGRAQLLEAYQEFKPTVDALRSELADSAKRREHPSILGQGSNSEVFSIDHGDRAYAVRVPRGGDTKPDVIDDKLAGAILAKGVTPRLEQVVAASYDDGVTVAEIMPGTDLDLLPPEEVESITNEELEGLTDTLVTANEVGLKIDPKPSNFRRDPDVGIGALDFSSNATSGEGHQSLSEAVVCGAWALGRAGAGYDKTDEKTQGYFERRLARVRTNLDVMKRYRTIVSHRLEGEDRAKALIEIDKEIELYQRDEKAYSDPEWVAKAIEASERQRAQIAEAKRRRGQDPPQGTSSNQKLDLI